MHSLFPAAIRDAVARSPADIRQLARELLKMGLHDLFDVLVSSSDDVFEVSLPAEFRLAS